MAGKSGDGKSLRDEVSMQSGVRHLAGHPYLDRHWMLLTDIFADGMSNSDTATYTQRNF